MIIETILSSVGMNNQVNFAPVGIHIPDNIRDLSSVDEFVFYLYCGSDTYENLKTTPQGVINFSDDVLSFVDTALYSRLLPAYPSVKVIPPRMAEAKSIWEFAVTHFDDSRQPAKVTGQVLVTQALTGFAGFCRATGVILEAAIASTRLQWLPENTIVQSWLSWQEVVRKTGGLREKEAFSRLTDYLSDKGVSVQNYKEER